MSPRVKIYLVLLAMVSLLGIIRFKRLTLPFRILGLVILLTLISECIARWLAMTIKNSNPPYPFFICLEYIGFTFIYRHFLLQRKLKEILTFSIPVFVFLCILNTVFFQSFFVFPSNILLIEHALLVVYALLLFKQMLNTIDEEIAFAKDIFWLNNAVLLYYALNFLIRAVHNFFVRKNLDVQFIGWVNYGLNLLFYLILGVSILLNYRKTVSAWKQ